MGLIYPIVWSAAGENAINDLTNLSHKKPQIVGWEVLVTCADRSATSCKPFLDGVKQAIKQIDTDGSYGPKVVT